MIIKATYAHSHLYSEKERQLSTFGKRNIDTTSSRTNSDISGALLGYVPRTVSTNSTRVLTARLYPHHAGGGTRRHQQAPFITQDSTSFHSTAKGKQRQGRGFVKNNARWPESRVRRRKIYTRERGARHATPRRVASRRFVPIRYVEVSEARQRTF